MRANFLPSLRELLPIPPYRFVPERLDQPEHESDADLRRILRDLWLANRLGGGAVIVDHLQHFTRRWEAGRRLRVLDLATGLADIPLQVVRWAERRGLEVDVLATDVSEKVLAVAREYLGPRSRVRLEVQDARRLPYPDQGFDVVVCSQALHHFERGDAVLVLREMKRLARTGLVLSDLERCLGAWAFVNVVARTPLVGGLTRDDGPASVSRSFTALELLQLARDAGIRGARIHRHSFFRQALVAGTGTGDVW